MQGVVVVSYITLNQDFTTISIVPLPATALIRVEAVAPTRNSERLSDSLSVPLLGKGDDSDFLFFRWGSKRFHFYQRFFRKMLPKNMVFGTDWLQDYWNRNRRRLRSKRRRSLLNRLGCSRGLHNYSANWEFLLKCWPRKTYQTNWL